MKPWGFGKARNPNARPVKDKAGWMNAADYARYAEARRGAAELAEQRRAGKRARRGARRGRRRGQRRDGFGRFV